MLKFAFGTLVAASLAIVAVPVVAQQQVIGNDLVKCASGASGPAILVTVAGFKAAAGKVRVQTYPATKSAWLEKGAWINRIETPVKSSGAMKFCLPVPAEGSYGIAVRHDRNGNGKTDLSEDGGGFSNNPSISIFNLGKPSVTKAAFKAGKGVTAITINLKYM